MAHWAELDDSNVVIRVVVADDEATEETLKEIFNGGNWKQTSYNTVHGVHLLGGTPFRKNYATVGGIYDPVRDAFIAPQPPNVSLAGNPLTFIFNENTCDWELI